MSLVQNDMQCVSIKCAFYIPAMCALMLPYVP